MHYVINKQSKIEEASITISIVNNEANFVLYLLPIHLDLRTNASVWNKQKLRINFMSAFFTIEFFHEIPSLFRVSIIDAFGSSFFVAIEYLDQ